MCHEHCCKHYLFTKKKKRLVFHVARFSTMQINFDMAFILYLYLCVCFLRWLIILIKQEINQPP